MIPSLTSAAVLALSLVPSQVYADNSDLVGTWSTKSKAVTTGPVRVGREADLESNDFYDPVTEDMKEPNITGTSMSFTSDGYFEQAFYIAVANPQDPTCPTALMQWQHGSYQVADNGSVVLTPIKVDGRQLLSEPCENKNAVYTRWNSSTYYQSYEVLQDTFRNEKRLNLYEWDGTPFNPMWLVYNPPEMLPTTTLNPTTGTKTGAGATSTSSKKKLKRSLPPNLKKAEDINADRWWWIGVGLTSLGFFGYFCV